MALENGEKLNRIEELKSKLFSKNYQTKVEHRDNLTPLKESEVPDHWTAGTEAVRNMGEKFFVRTTFFKKFFIFSLVFFGLAVAYGSYMFFIQGNTVSSNNIDIAILGNAFTSGGEELPLQISITNRNNSALELVDLVLAYPKSSEPGSEIERVRESLGTIPAGAIRNENVKVLLFGEQGSQRKINVSIEFRVEGSNAIFVKDKDYEVNINSTPINLSINAPETASSNEEINLGIKASLNATKPASQMLLRVDYPVSFQFISATPAPAFGNNVWDLGDLAPGAEKDINIQGKMLDVSDGEEKVFRVWAGSQSLTDKSLIDVVFNSLEQKVTINKALIAAELFVNGIHKSEYGAYTNSPISAEIRFSNNLDTSVKDLVISAKISGNVLDKKTINAERGFYNSSTDTIVWDKNSLNKLRELNPGDEGSVHFSFSPLPLFSAGAGMLSSPAVSIIVIISGKQDVSGYESQNLSNKDEAKIKIISEVGLAAKALYFSGPFKNTGPIPPQADKDTTYTIVWSLSNTANTISKASVTASLPTWVEYADKVSLASENITYNATTKEIKWNVGSIARGAGITTTGKEISFMVRLHPSLSQLNTAPTLVNDAVLTGHDDFANVDVRVNKASLNTRLINDALFPAGGDRVTE